MAAYKIRLNTLRNQTSPFIYRLAIYRNHSYAKNLRRHPHTRMAAKCHPKSTSPSAAPIGTVGISSTVLRRNARLLGIVALPPTTSSFLNILIWPRRNLRPKRHISSIVQSPSTTHSVNPIIMATI